MKFPWQTENERHYVLDTGDWHVGSMYAPCPERFMTSYGSVHQPNIGQAYLNEAFADMVAGLPMLDAIIYGGDLMDGVQPKDGGRWLWEIDPEWQMRAAKRLALPIHDKLKPDGQVLFFEGTCYHDGLGGMWAEQLARELGAIPDENGHCARAWEPKVMICGVPLDISHTQSYVMVNRSMPLEREIRYMLAEESLETAAYGILRHHAHSNWVEVRDGLRRALSVPAWQLQSHYAQKGKTPNRTRSRWLGSALIEIDPTAIQRNEPPVTFHSMLYPHPQRKPIVLVK